MSDAISSYQCSLMLGTVENDETTWERLCEIRDFPDLTDVKQALDVTTTRNSMFANIEGIGQSEQRAFSCNYNEDDFEKVAALKGQLCDVAMWFGKSSDGAYDGHDGKFIGAGYLDIFINGAGINEPVNMTIVLTMTKGFSDTFDELIVPWTDSDINYMTDENGEIIYFNLASGGSVID